MRDVSFLRRSKALKNDEFFTKIADIEDDLYQFINNFKDKTIYCNCDDYRISNFYKYFSENFSNFGLHKLICTCYQKDDQGLGIIKTSIDEKEFKLKENGDFRSKECNIILNKSDIIVTNPPFSLFREYMSIILNSNKKFVILGTVNAIGYRDIFPFFINNSLRVFGKSAYKFTNEVEGYRRVSAKWFTNFDMKLPDKIKLKEIYTPEKYPKYENYNAINVDSVSKIPYDYDGIMGVPISFITSYNPNQFEIIRFRKGDDDRDLYYYKNSVKIMPYSRILIRKIS